MNNYFIVHSVKGGCGKSALSLFTGLLLSRDEDNTIIVDCDLSASATHKLYVPNGPGDLDKIKINSGSIKANALNEFLRGDVIDIDDIINKIYFNWDNEGIASKNQRINYIFAHSNNSKLSDFRFNIGSNRANNISIGLFKNRFKKVLDLIKANDNYSNAVFDMAASSNEYSYMVYKQLQELNCDKKVLVLVTTADTAHIEETRQYLKEVITGDTLHPRFDNIIVIINNLANYNDGIKTLMNCKGDFDHIINNAKLSDAEYIEFVELPFQESYFKLTHGQEMVALNNLNITDYTKVLDKLMGAK